MSELFLKIKDFVGLAYWAEIKTENPKCVYYFGPFNSAEEASNHSNGYLEDLKAEGAQNIKVVIKRCKPSRLTVCDDSLTSSYKKK